MKLVKKLWLLAVVAMSACGTGVDPVKIAALNDGFPQLGVISSSATALGGFLSGNFTASTPYWTFNSGAVWGGSYLAPADGIISQVGLTTISSTQTNFVTITHSARLASRFYGLQQVVVRAGDSVLQGQSVGTFFNATGIIFQVLLDGTPVCPLSFMNQTFRANFASLTQNPCQ
jgi:murein DD-endopeptidase MepM/ murein hydrolase activator NlpD